MSAHDKGKPGNVQPPAQEPVQRHTGEGADSAFNAMVKRRKAAIAPAVHVQDEPVQQSQSKPPHR